MSAYPYRLPSYEMASATLVSQLIRGFTRAQSPLLQMIRHVTTDELPSQVIPDQQGEVVSQPVTQQQIFVMRNRDIISANYEALLEGLFEAGAGFAAQMERHVLQRVTETCEATGQVVSAGGREISHDLMLDALEAVEWDFNDDGSVDLTGKAFVVSPAAAEAIGRLPPPTEAHERRHAQIEARKREEWRARRRRRRIH